MSPLRPEQAELLARLILRFNKHCKVSEQVFQAAELWWHPDWLAWQDSVNEDVYPLGTWTKPGKVEEVARQLSVYWTKQKVDGIHTAKVWSNLRQPRISALFGCDSLSGSA
ncbi:hypothetical protein F5883DRAFT_528399 [Diaporthe sp. PMI_573]|nr:hypothetical protein F5883DRAFT_528399 [Diaporthaceae sp. PMI_573]